MKTAIPAILLVLVSRGKKTSDTSIVGIETIPRSIPKTIPKCIRNEKNKKNGIAIPKTIPKVRDTSDTKSIRNGLNNSNLVNYVPLCKNIVVRK